MFFTRILIGISLFKQLTNPMLPKDNTLNYFEFKFTDGILKSASSLQDLIGPGGAGGLLRFIAENEELRSACDRSLCGSTCRTSGARFSQFDVAAI